MPSSVIRFYKENGAALTIQALRGSVYRRVFNGLVSMKVKGHPRINIHPSAFIRGLSHVEFGEHFRAGRHFWLEAVIADGERRYSPRISIGNNVIVNDDVHIAATNYISIGDNVLMASRIFISDHNHGSYQDSGASDPEVPPRLRVVSSDKRVIIEDNVWIGEMVSVLPGVVIGRGSVIGGNSVVTRSIPAHSIAIGNPARVIKRFSAAERQWKAVPPTHAITA